MTQEHPCPSPVIPKKTTLFDGVLWGCACGRMYRYKVWYDAYGDPHPEWELFEPRPHGD